MIERPTITYIIRTQMGECYCSKTDDITKRLQEHKDEQAPDWFAYSYRKDWKNIIYFNGDIERQIKEAGAILVYDLIIASRKYNENATGRFRRDG